MNNKVSILAVVGLVVALITSNGGQAIAKAPLVVDDDGVECPKADIQPSKPRLTLQVQAIRFESVLACTPRTWSLVPLKVASP